MNEQLQNVLSDLAVRFGTTVEHLWTVMVKQAYINGAVGMVSVAAWIVFTYTMFKTTPRLVKQAYISHDDGESFVGMIAVIIGWATVVVWGVVTAISVDNIVTMLFNPEYWALQQVFNLLSQ